LKKYDFFANSFRIKEFIRGLGKISQKVVTSRKPKEERKTFLCAVKMHNHENAHCQILFCEALAGIHCILKVITLSFVLIVNYYLLPMKISAQKFYLNWSIDLSQIQDNQHIQVGQGFQNFFQCRED